MIVFRDVAECGAGSRGVTSNQRPMAAADKAGLEVGQNVAIGEAVGLQSTIADFFARSPLAGVDLDVERNPSAARTESEF